MGTLIIYSFIFFGFLFGSNEVYRVSELRTYYHKATKCAETGNSFHKFMAEYDGKEARILAFKGASEAVMAKYTWSPYSKLKHLKTSAEIFNEAVKLDADDPEVRFLRYTVEYYIPRYLNMSANVPEDKKIVVNSILKYPKSGIDAESCKLMRDFLLTANHLTEPEKQQLRTVKI
jgi:hypothetical protein